jgi:predicted AlkP superfamily pyrophosphatase or phosphodiesterase
MLTWTFSLFGLLWSTPAIAQGSPAADEGPRLVVVVVVDQMRADYLDRFQSQFVGGLAWLLENGAVFGDAHHDHAVTSTAPGHATLATGVFPARHGIVGNEFYDRWARRAVYSVADSTSAIVGYPEAAGRSPRNLLRDGIADWVKSESPASRVFSVAIKDRAAIPLGGKGPDGAYWFQTSSGDFVTASYYGDGYPRWVSAFNASDRAERYYGSSWTKLLPDSAYRLSREDDFAAESDAMSRTFPHRFAGGDSAPGREYYAQLPETPFGDELTLDFAAEIVANEDLGRDDSPDLLLVGLSSADYIGHAYGPYSQEVQDYYLRLDRMLGDFFAHLERAIPSGRFVIVLTADHGVMAMPEQLARDGVDAGRTDPGPIRAEIRVMLEEAIRLGEISQAPDVHETGGLCFDFDDAPSANVEEIRLRRRLAESLRKVSDLGVVFAYEELALGLGEGELFAKFTRSFHPNRGADVVYAPREHYLLTTGKTRTSHGSPYEYDTHVPLIFAGHGLGPTRIDRFVRTVDLAPTLAALMGIQAPVDLDGRDLGLARDPGANR